MREEDSIQEVLDSVESKPSVGDSKWCDRDIQTLSKKLEYHGKVYLFP